MYELLTGKQAFHGEDVTDILAAVVRAEPDWQALPPATPVKIRDLLRRCLRKDKNQRLRDAGDARIEIQEAQTAPYVTEPAPPQPQTTFAWMAATAVLLLALVALSVCPPPRDACVATKHAFSGSATGAIGYFDVHAFSRRQICRDCRSIRRSKPVVDSPPRFASGASLARHR